jgi:hypothetical protein
MTPRCRLGRHRWVQHADEHRVSCFDCGKSRPIRKNLFCYLGLHNWIAFQNDESRYLACRRCGKYGGDPHPLVPW